MIQRQALAGLLWSKQIYLFDVNRWLEGDNPNWPPPESRWHGRNTHWRHLNSMRILLMPDKWEYPWFAAWDLAFHCISMALIDPAFAKDNLWFLLVRAVPAHQRDRSRLRVGVQRSQPAGSRLGLLARVRNRALSRPVTATACSSRNVSTS
jgi:hypothetical protein